MKIGKLFVGFFLFLKYYEKLNVDNIINNVILKSVEIFMMVIIAYKKSFIQMIKQS